MRQMVWFSVATEREPRQFWGYMCKAFTSGLKNRAAATFSDEEHGKEKVSSNIKLTSAEAAHLDLLAWWVLSIHTSHGSWMYREEGSELGHFFSCIIRNVLKCVGFNNMQCLVVEFLQNISEYTYP